jgi:hypothetical protein
MKSLQWIGLALLIPLAMAGYFARSLWTSVLALLAGFGMVQARCDKAAGGTSDPTKPEPMVLCYEQVSYKYFVESEWDISPTMQAWAGAERDILVYARSGAGDFSVMEKKIAAAQSAYAAVQKDVENGNLRRDVYQAAGDILGEWHCDIAVSSTNVECYQKVSVPPMVAQVNQRLFALNQMVKEGKLSAAASGEAQAGIKQSLGQSLAPEAADQLSRLLIELLGFS